MYLAALGDWNDPIPTEGNEQFIASVISNSGCRCMYCGFSSTQTANEPYGKLKVCSTHRENVVDVHSCITICEFCVRLNRISNLENAGDPIGTFVELPWMTQSEVNNMLRVIYCYDYLASLPDSDLLNTKIHMACAKLSKVMSKIPSEWKQYGFDGSPSSLQTFLDGYSGYKQDSGSTLYVDRLRFVTFENSLKDSIQYWSSLLELEIRELVNPTSEVI